MKGENYEKSIFAVTELGEEVVMILKRGTAVIEPLSLVNNSCGFVTFRMTYAGTRYESTEEVPYMDLPEGQLQVSWTEDDELEVVLLEEA